ncbi:unnamed protein product [Schistosoma margrebowiei]|uniref:Uncharacterized protein n=1 Tax=Schistosoma margrebowiei TaxID=48269 RepID=A0AA85AIL2_9TREM|nr:unnamed protein product [Schistosoma margrebowiei]
MGCGASGLKDCKSEVAESTNDNPADNTEIETEEHKETNTNHIVPVLSSEQLDLPSNNNQNDEPKEEIPYNQEMPDVSAITEQQPDLDLKNDVNQSEECNKTDDNVTEN